MQAVLITLDSHFPFAIFILTPPPMLLGVSNISDSFSDFSDILEDRQRIFGRSGIGIC